MHQAHKVTLAFVCSKAPIEEADNQILIASQLFKKPQGGYWGTTNSYITF